jgi:alpha-tubulin suppressor-like RCC1 family protein
MPWVITKLGGTPRRVARGEQTMRTTRTVLFALVATAFAATVLTATDLGSRPASAERARVSVRLTAGGDQTIIVYPGPDRLLGNINLRGLMFLPLDTGPIAGTQPPSDSRIFSASAGSVHSLLLTNDGYVLAGGRADYGQIGERSTVGTAAPNPYQLVGPAGGVTAVSAGWFHSLLLLRDGTVQAMGVNTQGQLGRADGLGTLVPQPSLVTVAGLTDVVAISAGYTHSLAVRRDGTVWSWGANFLGQLGRPENLGSQTPAITPGQVSGLSDVVDVAASNNFNYALRRDGTVWSWGVNNRGQLGYPDGAGNFVVGATPKQVPGLTGISSIATGRTFGAALRTDGTLFTWGDNTAGQLARSAALGAFTSTPGAAALAGRATAVAAGFLHLTVALEDGTVRAHGPAPTPPVPLPGGVEGGIYVGRPSDSFTVAGSLQPLGAFTRTVANTGQSGTGAALLNVTMTEGVRAGYVTADRCSTLTAGPQTKSNGNYTPGTNIANLAVVPLDPDGSFCIYTERSAHLLGDLQGTFSPGGSLGFQRVDPTRLLDTRLG